MELWVKPGDFLSMILSNEQVVYIGQEQEFEGLLEDIIDYHLVMMESFHALWGICGACNTTVWGFAKDRRWSVELDKY
jgi:hypothetical protein